MYRSIRGGEEVLRAAYLNAVAAAVVVGHASKLSFGRLAGVPVVAQAGRYHLYEGKALNLVTYPIRVFGALGAKAVIRGWTNSPRSHLPDALGWHALTVSINPSDECCWRTEPGLCCAHHLRSARPHCDTRAGWPEPSGRSQ